MQVLIMISVQTVDISNFIQTFKKSFKNENKLQIFKLFTESLWNKGQNKEKRERNDEYNGLI